jgi:hypothetical protein
MLAVANKRTYALHRIQEICHDLAYLYHRWTPYWSLM